MSQGQSAVAIICVTHSRPELLMKCLESCAMQDYVDKDVLVVFNPNDEKTERKVCSGFPQFKVLKTHRNIGFFPALNLAIANCKSDFVMIVDDDARFLSPDALSKLVQCFRNEPALGAVTCTLEGPNEKREIESDRYIRAFTTGFTMLPRKVMTEWVGYVPDLFFRSAGETFWCTQLWEQRRPVKRVRDIRMFHELSMRGRSKSDWYFHGLRSQLLCALIREPAAWLIPVLLSKLVKSFWGYFRRGYFILWTKAWISFLVHVSEALQLRKPISSHTRRLLHRLDRAKVRNLADLPEWTKLAKSEAESLRAKQPVT